MSDRLSHGWLGYSMVFAGCMAGAFTGLPIPFERPDQALMWPPSAVALAGGLVLGHRAAAAVWAGTATAVLLHGLPIAETLAIATGQGVATVVGTWILQHTARGARAFERADRVLIFAASAVLVSTITALAAFAALAAGDPARTVAPDEGAIAWWWAEVTGLLVVAPALVLWGLRPRFSLARRRGDRRSPERGSSAWTHERAREGSALALVTLMTAVGVFGGGLDRSTAQLMALLAPFPVLTWAALRFGARETATVGLAFGVAAVWSWTNPGTSVLDLSLRPLQWLLIGLSLESLVLAAAIDQRNRQDSELHLLAVTDPLTGLANYRHLTGSIDRHIRRARQTGEPFALLLLDVDNLKVINDQLGHNVGSRLLVRLADALRASCRVTDLIARYGGDEFAVLLPGCDESAARVQAARAQAALDADTATPPIAASMGIAVFPRDGDTADQLLDRADDELYAMKGRGQSSRRP